MAEEETVAAPVIEEGAAKEEVSAKEAEEGEEAEYFVDDESGDSSEVVILMAILNQGGSALQGRRIWRRLVVPADFSLLELHVVLQNAFDWEDTHLHDFNQPLGVDLLGGISLPGLSSHGPTDIPSYTQYMVDVEKLEPPDVRTFRAVVGIKDDATDDLVLTKAEEAGEGETADGSEEGEGEKKAENKKAPRPAQNCLVYVEHSHPHADVDTPVEERKEELASGPTAVLEERAFLVGDVLTSELPVVVYEYDFRLGYEVHLFFEGRSRPSEGVNYPTCLAGQGASPAEDGDDMDDQGNLLPSYNYDDFAVLDVLANFEKTFEDSWPLGPGAADKRAAPRCYLCRYNRECGRRRECSGRCCDYCHKAPLAAEAGRLLLSSAHKLYEKAANKIKEARRKWSKGEKCDWVEKDGQPCAVCPE